MPRGETFVTALDLGSDHIKMAAARDSGDSNYALEVAALEEIPALGVRRGVVEDVDTVADLVVKARDRLSSHIGEPITDVMVNVAGNHLFVQSSRGVVAVSRADQRVSEEDVERVLKSARALSLPNNQQAFTIMQRGFIVDSSNAVNDPIEMTGTRLEVDIAAICGFSPYIRSLTQAMSTADLDVIDFVPSAVAASRAVLEARQKELGVAVVDIGARTTSIAVYIEGELVHLKVLPVGSGHITDDLGIGLQTEVDIAEYVKREYGDCKQQKGGSDKVTVTMSEVYGDDLQGEDEEMTFSRRKIVSVTASRVKQIMKGVHDELKAIEKEDNLPAGIVITGGGAAVPNIGEAAREVSQLPCKVARPRGVKGLQEDPRYAVLAGLLQEGITEEKDNAPSEYGGGGIGERLRNIFRIFMP